MDPNDHKKTACYDIDVEVEDPLKSQMSSFLLSTANQQEIASLDNKVCSLAATLTPLKLFKLIAQMFQIHETIESINQLKIQRDFMLSFSRDPKGYIQDWLKSQSRDLKVGSRPSCCSLAAGHVELVMVGRGLSPVFNGSALSLAVAHDRRGGEPRGGEEGIVLPRALVPGSRQPLFLLQGGGTVLRLSSSSLKYVPVLISFSIQWQIQQRRQELEQALAVRTT